ncbi:EI24 domain-containing protein [Nitrosophilus kaiyonis]|uniref:EI24 domain-containing protein n=1 Tax=Nitrosophilus kaiyonis TaxID=2930200 RepID=UPI002491DBCB|nr:EI24 domain-containing protein [Nitrosophilus kaiyonis]
MVKFNYFFVKSIKDVLTTDSIKLALITGIPVLLLWFGIGWLLWDVVTSYTYKIITWIPFSIIRANGAFIISFFIWFLATMITYAFIIGLFTNFFYKNIESRFYEFLNVLLILMISVFWSAVIIFKWNLIYEEIKKLLTWLPFETVDQGISYLLAIYIFYNFFVITLYLVVFIYKEPYLSTLKDIHYPDIDSQNNIKSNFAFAILSRDIFLFIVFMLAAVPVLFIPFANFLIIWFLWTWLYKESAFLGVCSMFCADYDFDELKHHRLIIWSIALTASVLNFIPIISFFTPFFVLTMYFHWIMHHKKIMRS